MDLNTKTLTQFNNKSFDKNNYTLSLIEGALKSGKLSYTDAFNIQNKLMEILKALILRYTKGESTSLTVETTESLLNSMLYALDFYFLKIDNPESSLMELVNGDINKIYYEGVELLRLYVIETHKLYLKIKKERLNIELDAYNATLDEAISIFFEKYNIVFEAPNGMGSIDYPLVFDDWSVKGISYIRNYLEHLKIETEFCKLFSEKDIKTIVEGYEKMCRLTHSIELINIFEILINNSIFSVIAGNEGDNIYISKYQAKKIKEQFEFMDAVEISVLIDESVMKVLVDLQIKNPLLIDYINNYKELLKKRIDNAAPHQSLNSLIVVEEDTGSLENVISFGEVKRMSEKEFKFLVSSIMECSEGKDKAALINSNVHSFQDFIDILNADCIFENEFYEIFNSLSDIELTILTKITFYEEIRDGQIDLNILISKKEETEYEWQEYFMNFLESLISDHVLIGKIEELVNRIDCDIYNLIFS